MAQASSITPRSTDFARWYQDVIAQAELAEAAEVVKGCMVIKPDGYSIWEILQSELDRRFKATGHRNAYFPLLIPESFLKREAEHVEGFSPELAVVTIAGGEKLEEPYVIRPTSETIIGHFYARWIKSWRDLPLLINQWCNIMRWELRTRIFLRTTEFLWQEGHTAHATEAEAKEEVLRMLDVYADVAENVMAMPVVKGVKSAEEKFAGAVRSFSMEAMMQSGLALQAGTSHELGQNFARAFDIKFQDNTGNLQYAWQTSWGVTTRLIGGLIMTHADDKGMVLPPRCAWQPMVIIPILRKGGESDALIQKAHQLADALKAAGVNTHVDDRQGLNPGNKFFHWEQKGIPLVAEIGPRELEQGMVVVKRRDTGAKETVAADTLTASVPKLLETIQNEMLIRARQRLKENTVLADSVAQVAEILNPVSAEKGGGKFVMAHLKDDKACDARIKELKASVRNIPLVDEFDGPGKCIVTGETVDRRSVIAKAY